MAKSNSLADGFGGTNDHPGDRFVHLSVIVTKVGSRFCAVAEETWGSNQGYLEQHGSTNAVALAEDWDAALATLLSRGREAKMEADYLSTAVTEAHKAMCKREAEVA